VTDRGIGIPAHEQSKIFRKFYRVAGSTHTSHGSGLGLAIVAHLVRVHNGRLHVTSEVGTGTTITVHLPLLAGTGER
jgi:signal transduction histidine kinase